MNTKQKGDIGETAVQLKAMKLGFGVLQPIGDRLPYDMVFDVNGKLLKIQVKTAWYNEKDDVYVVDVRRTKTNRRVMKREKYKNDDFEYAIVYIDELNRFYIFPSEIFNSYGGSISLVENIELRQRIPKSQYYLEKWELIFENTKENVL